MSWKACKSYDHQTLKIYITQTILMKQNHEKISIKGSVQVLCETYHNENIQLSSIRNSLKHENHQN